MAVSHTAGSWTSCDNIMRNQAKNIMTLTFQNNFGNRGKDKSSQKTSDLGRIIGGEEADCNKYPWMVLLPK